MPSEPRKALSLESNTRVGLADPLTAFTFLLQAFNFPALRWQAARHRRNRGLKGCTRDCVVALSRQRAGIHMLAASKSKKGKKSGKKSAPVRVGGRGFASSEPKGDGKLLKDPQYEALYAWLRSSPKTNIGKVAVAEFDGLRGVMALKDIAPGEEIVGIPAKFAVKLGTESRDPVPAAQQLLKIRSAECEPAYELDEDEIADGVTPLPSSPRAVYWATLPQPDSPDVCTPDFFTEKELEMLQWPPLLEDISTRYTQVRRALGMDASSSDASPSSLGNAGLPHELLWAVWVMLSRALTCQGPAELGTFSGSVAYYKLLIPFIDMFNHKGGCKHYLTGRTDGMLRVVAGAPIKAGEQVFILYGDEDTSNQEFLAHYGFFDPSASAAAADSFLIRQHQASVSALRATTAEEDAALLAAKPPPPYREQLALKLRLALKRIAAKQGLLPD